MKMFRGYRDMRDAKHAVVIVAISIYYSVYIGCSGMLIQSSLM